MFSLKDIEKISNLIKIPVSEDEKIKLISVLSQTVENINMLNELNTANIEATYQVTGLVNVFQDAKLSQTLTHEEVLSNSKKSKEGMLVTQAVLDRE